MWLCLVLAAAKPEWIGPPIEQQKSGRDLMIAVDLSGSMATADFTLPDSRNVDRLEAGRTAGSTGDQRASDRLGLIVFGNALPAIPSPATTRYGPSCWQKHKSAWPARARRSATPLAWPSNCSGKRFRQPGADHTHRWQRHRQHGTPVDAARVAASQDIRIYTIAIGDPATVGEEALDTDTLQRVSEITGAVTLGLDREELASAYTANRRLGTRVVRNHQLPPRQSLHWVPVGAALVLYLISQRRRVVDVAPLRSARAA